MIYFVVGGKGGGDLGLTIQKLDVISRPDYSLIIIERYAIHH